MPWSWRAWCCSFMPCAMYSGRTGFLSIPGEFFVLLIYMAGTWLGPAVAMEGSFETGQGMIALIFMGVLLMNLGVISLYDMKLDSRMGITSLANLLGMKRTKNLLLGTAIAIYLISLLQFMVFEMDRYSQYRVDPCRHDYHSAAGSLLSFTIQEKRLLPAGGRCGSLYGLSLPAHQGLVAGS